jgi:hypothetical protein
MMSAMSFIAKRIEFLSVEIDCKLTERNSQGSRFAPFIHSQHGTIFAVCSPQVYGTTWAAFCHGTVVEPLLMRGGHPHRHRIYERANARSGPMS